VLSIDDGMREDSWEIQEGQEIARKGRNNEFKYSKHVQIILS